MLFSVKNITFDSNGEVFVKYPLGNVMYLNKDNWKFSEDIPTVFNELENNLGHDLTILKAGNGFVHPYNYPNGNTIDEVYNDVKQYQQPYVIGKNDRVYRSVDENGFIWGRYHISHPRAKEYFKELSNSKDSEIPFHSSIMLATRDKRDDIKHFKVIHNSIVDQPQWGFNSTMRAICVGSNGQCEEALLTAGMVQPCENMTNKYNNFFSSLNSYILSAGNITDMSQENPKPEGNDEGEGGGEGGKLSSSGNENKNKMPIDINWKDEVKKYVDESITAKLPKVETLPTNEEKANNKPLMNKDVSQQIDVNNLPQNVIDSIAAKVSEKYDAQIKNLTDANTSLKTTVDSFQVERKEQNIGRMLLEYEDFFRGKDGKIDSKLFDDNLKYWSAKQGKEEDIKQDFEHSLQLAKNYIGNLSLPTEQSKVNITESVTHKETDQPVSKRDRIMEEVENENMKLGVVQKAGNVQQDELEQRYQNTLANLKKGNNENIVNSNERVY